MKKRSLKATLATLMLGMAAVTLTGCNDKDSVEYVPTDDFVDGCYVYQAEDTDISDLSGVAFSGNYPGYDMIRGLNSPSIPTNVKNSISGGYFVSYFNANGLELVFNITAEADVTGAELSVRMGSEFGALDINSDSLGVIVNDEEIEYDSIAPLKGSTGSYSTTFSDIVIGDIDLVEGENQIIVYIVDTEAFGAAGEGKTFGPGIDCIKIKTETKLTWPKLLEAKFDQIRPNN